MMTEYEIKENEILDNIEKHISGSFEMLRQVPFRSITSYRYKYECDAVLQKDGRNVVLIDVALHIDTPTLVRRKGNLNSVCYAFHIPCAIITDGKQALLFNLDTGFTKEKMPITEALKLVSQQFNFVPEDAASSLYLFKKMKEAAKKKEVPIDDTTLKDLLKGSSKQSNGEIIVDEKAETNFFKSLLGEVTDKEVCRYTKLGSLRRILNDKKASVCSIVGMNDKSECYYYDSYMQNAPIMDFSANSPKVVERLNSNFIMSCSDVKKLDKLTMWRMYGDDAKGVCLVYSINEMKDNFILAPVSYAEDSKTHARLDFLKELIDVYHFVFPLIDVWKHFFKPSEYADEGEIRLLYKATDESKYKWIQGTGDILCPIVEFPIEKNDNQFPLVLKEVWLGPKFPETDINRSQIEMYTNQLDVKYDGGKLEVKVSLIDNYR